MIRTSDNVQSPRRSTFGLKLSKVPFNEPDSNGRRARDLAKDKEIIAIIRSYENPTTTRGGTGNAFAAGVWEERHVTALLWFNPQ